MLSFTSLVRALLVRSGLTVTLCMEEEHAEAGREWDGDMWRDLRDQHLRAGHMDPVKFWITVWRMVAESNGAIPIITLL